MSPVVLAPDGHGRGGQDYSGTVQLTQEAQDELSWWERHLTKWNGRLLLGEPLPDNHDRHIQHRLGSGMLGGPNWRPVVKGESDVHKLPETPGSTLAVKCFFPGQMQNPNPSEDRQHNSRLIHKQIQRDCVP